MNYRALFIISILILVVGVGGLFFLPSPSEETPAQTTEAPPPPPPPVEVEEKKIVEVLVTTATANRDLKKGMLLQADDYTLSQVKVEETSPLVESDLSELIKSGDSGTLQGFLVAENLTSGSLLSKNNVISPNDTRFLISSLDPTQEVAYRIYIKEPEQYILDTLRQGDSVSIYNQQRDLDRSDTEKMNLVKLVDNLTVLQVKIFKTNDVESQESGVIQNTDFLGYVAVKLNAAKLKELYSLENGSKLIVMPSHKAGPTNHRGAFVRELRGNK